MEAILASGWKGIGSMLLLLSGVVEVIPIKINPWSWLLKKIGGVINAPVMEEIKSLEQEVKTLKQEVKGVRTDLSDSDIDRLRWSILDFSNSCRNGRRHSREEFSHVIKAYNNYEHILEERGLENGEVDLDYEFIKDIYKHCLETNDFIG